MSEQLEYHAYDRDGKYVGMVIATPDQFKATGFVAGNQPVIDPEIALTQARASASMPRLNFAKLALREGWITAAEAKAWVPGNALPQIVTDIIAQHIEGGDKQDIAEINALGQMVVNRNDLLLRLLMVAKKVTDAQMDAHFIAAAQVKA